ncbi:hypothetical protein [Thermoflavimicrobium dichotomicum]|uniref:Uncharacterized protein n=1 Tax=Thermoflavimicrobium dichotomicum TaxID=46223 RepID=A0A1I3UII5_9BACL|nr:hypothetical protein [Thermoflavimicrobium dichotomicum]SFJ81557.1 hypothetical protein SAMN05421852_12420 [Thermoflavimicrobium dichotomicum]
MKKQPKINPKEDLRLAKQMLEDIQVDFERIQTAMDAHELIISCNLAWDELVPRGYYLRQAGEMDTYEAIGMILAEIGKIQEKVTQWLIHTPIQKITYDS